LFSILKLKIEEGVFMMKHQNMALSVSVFIFCVFFTGLVYPEDTAAGDKAAPCENITHAVAVLHPTYGNNVSGEVRFSEVEGGVRVTAELRGLKPGKHGFHIHALGDCSAPDGTSSGGHYNPMGKAHGGPDSAERHVGDLGNITADKSGRASYDRVDRYLSLKGPYSIVGHAVIVHAGEDDFVSQPTGNAGARVACGVIGIAGE
jgi:superoxide dismutase, Cu-Zn family